MEYKWGNVDLIINVVDGGIVDPFHLHDWLSNPDVFRKLKVVGYISDFHRDEGCRDVLKLRYEKGGNNETC